jgi:site-specific DNA recombinase
MTKKPVGKHVAASGLAAPQSKSAKAATAVIYARVSTPEQERDGFSLPAQLQLLREYARQQGFTVPKELEFVETETAARAGRTAFGQMTQFLERHSCRAILVEKTDRLYRNFKDWVRIDELGVPIHFVKENVVVGPDSRSADKFLHGIKVLMAKNYIDNLGEEVRKGMLEKARQGHWPSYAPVGYRNNPVTHRIEPDPERAPVIAKVFEWYATGQYSLKAVTAKAAAAGLTNTASGRPLVRAKIHQVLQNPIYCGDFRWLGKLYQGHHEPIVSRDCFKDVQDVFAAANRPRYGKHQHAFAGLLTCGRCGSAYTAEVQKGKYVYYHCTGHRGRCGNTYVREEDLALLFGELVKRVRIPAELADAVASALRDSQSDKERFVLTTTMRLQQQQLLLRAKLDRAYDDRLSGQISEELWTRKSAELESQLETVRTEMARHEHASHDYEKTGLQILELAQSAYSQYVTQNAPEQARLLKILLSNCAFDRGSLIPTYNKPFDLLARGSETGDWLLRLDSNQQPSG